MVFSAQQIKFEFLSYIKEFDVNPRSWRIGVAEDARRALFMDNSVDEIEDVWLWKPALSAAAAQLVFSFFVQRFGIEPAAHAPTSKASNVFIFRKSDAVVPQS